MYVIWVFVTFTFFTDASRVYWNIQNWSKCYFNKTCNRPGFKTRLAICMNRNGELIAVRTCERQLGYIPKQLEACVPDQCLKNVRKHVIKTHSDWTKCTPLGREVRKTLLNNTQRLYNDSINTACKKGYNLVLFAKSRRCRYYIDYLSFGRVEIDTEAYENVLQQSPVEYESCFYACINHCLTSQWSQWHYCKHCKQKRTIYKVRTYASIPYLENFQNECPSAIKMKRKYSKNDSFSSSQHRLFPWSKGKVIHGKKNKLRLLTFTVQRRKATCIGRTGSECTNTNDAIASIKISVTDRNCSLTQWSQWSPCHNGKTYQRREIIHLPLRDGKPCDVLKRFDECQTIESESNPTVYAWYSGGWTLCDIKEINQKLGCVFYRKSRAVFCTMSHESVLTPVSDYHCNMSEKLSTEEVCHIQCQDSCIYEPWSSWSHCRNDISKRTRQLMNISLGLDCPRIQQKVRCNNYRWSYSPPKCTVKEIGRDCGTGHLTQNRTCVDESRNPVDETLCSPLELPILSKTCRIPCGGDCIVSDWSEWTVCWMNTRKRFREILSFSSQEGYTCPRLEENQACTYKDAFWVTSEWAGCTTNSSIPHALPGKRCFSGTQERNLTCVNNDIGNVVHSSHCGSLIKPHTRRKCETCAKDCVLTSWSDWAPDCSSVCSPWNTRLQPITTRQRFIVEHGNEYGRRCDSSLVETKTCPLCPTYIWITKKWDLCLHSTVPDRNFMSITGLQNGVQIRSVYCSNGRTVVNDGKCLMMDTPKPIEYRDCKINWLVSCNLQSWSEWDECSTDCGGGVQKRRRKFSSETCKSKENISLKETRSCNIQPCQEYFLQFGKWSACYPTVESEPCSPKFPFTTLGYQLRNISCQNRNGKFVPNVYCGRVDARTVLTKRSCVSPCSLDCRLSPWSSFSKCSASCGAGTTTRSRQIFAHNTNNGRVCPPSNRGGAVTETVPCKLKDCHENQWVTDQWSTCILNVSQSCGTGKKTRNIKCVNVRTGSPSTECNETFRPSSEDGCTIFCENDCIVTKWSNWNACTPRTNGDGYVTRKRLIIRESQQAGNCPPLTEKRMCTAPRYTWRTTKWSSCILKSDEKACGLGFRRRFVDCVQSNGEIVSNSLCRSLEPVAMFEKCSIECTTDCQVSAWTSWSNCDQECNTVKYSIRQRFFLSKSDRSTCKSTSLTESLICPVVPCYELILKDWSDCEVQYKNTCGEGTQNRNAICRRSDGNHVDISYCSEYVTGRVKLTRRCRIPCWNDCILTSWSPWTSCFGICSQANKSILQHGYKYRHRLMLQNSSFHGKLCPRDLQQMEQCHDPLCFTTKWTANQTSKRGKFHCERSDGSILSHGCVPHGKSQQKKYRCMCPVKNAKCIRKRYCRCQRSYEPLLNEEGLLIDCVKHQQNSAGDESQHYLGLPILAWIIGASCIIYCILGTIIFILFRRYRQKVSEQKEQRKRRCCPTLFPQSSTQQDKVGEKESHALDPMREPRKLLRTRNEESMSSGVSSCSNSEDWLQSESREWSVSHLDEMTGPNKCTKL